LIPWGRGFESAGSGEFIKDFAQKPHKPRAAFFALRRAAWEKFALVACNKCI
jgi:hypothetical protein